MENKKKLVIIVDDSPVNLQIGKFFLEERFTVATVPSAARLFNLLEKSHPSLILLDIDMPEPDGYKTYRLIREIETVDDVPVLFLTGMTSGETELTVLELGAQDFLAKPFIRENLLARIRLRLDESHRMREMKDRVSAEGLDGEKFKSFTAGLTPAERETARLIVQGCANREIAGRLHYSTGYVKNLATSVYDKLGVRSRQELRAMFRGSS